MGIPFHRSRIFKAALPLLVLFQLGISAKGHAQLLVPPPRMEQVRPWLGVAIEAGKTGVRVKEVIAGTPAEEYGLKPGDEITAIDKTKVKGPDELIALVRSKGVGNTVTVEYLRGTKTERKDVKLVARPDELKLVRQKIQDKPVPDSPLETVSGEAISSLKAQKGKVTLVEFWATWCPACRSTHPRLSAYAKEAKARGISVVAISNEELAELKPYIAEAKPEFTVLRDKSGALQKELMVNAIPMILVVDKAGVMRYATIGAGSYLEEAIAEAEKLAAAK